MLLSELYMQDKDSLLKNLQNAPTSQEVIRVIHAYIANIADLKGEYVSGLTRSQARVALAILGLYQEHFRKLLDTFEQVANLTSEHPAPVSSQQRPSRSSGIPATEAIAGVGAASVVAGFIWNPLLAIPLGIGVGLFAATMLHSDKVPMSAPDGGSDTAAAASAIPRLDYNLFMADLEDIFKTVDNLVEKFGKLEEDARPRKVEPKLEDHTRFLEFIQDILGWYQRKKGELPETAQQVLESRLEEQLPDLFSEYNIQIRYHNPENSERELVLFDYEEEVGEPRLSAPLMTRPALSKEGKVLLRGRVIEPQQSRSITLSQDTPSKD